MSDANANVNTVMIASLDLGNLGNLRGTETEDLGSMWSVPDFINVMNDKELGNSYGRKTLENMLKGKHKDELVKIIHKLVIPGSQGRETQCADILGLQRVMSLLPGTIAAQYREEVQKVFNSVVAGDRSLIKVIEHNASTNTPVQRLVRESLKRKSGEIVIEEDPEDKKLRRMKLMAEITELEKKNEKMGIENLAMAEEMYTRLCVGGVIDDRARLLFKDGLMNTTVKSGSAAGPVTTITNGAACNTTDTRPVTISSLATELKIRMSNAQGQQAGRIMAKLYRDKYGAEPTSHDQFVDGGVRPVKSYTRADKDLIEQAIREATGR
jgi:hypothetical protein